MSPVTSTLLSCPPLPRAALLHMAEPHSKNARSDLRTALLAQQFLPASSPQPQLCLLCPPLPAPTPALSPQSALPAGCLDPWAFCVSPDLSLECPPSRMFHACPLPVIRVSGQMLSSERQNSFSHNTAPILKLLNSLTVFPLSTFSNEGLRTRKTA